MRERKYRPIEDSQTVEVIRNNQELDYVASDQKIHRDPKNQISPRVYKVIRQEKVIKIINMSISFSLMLIAIILFILTYTQVGIFTAKLYVGYLIIFGAIAFFTMVFGIKNAIENKKWSNTVQKYREALNIGDYNTSNTFHIAYRKIVLKDVNLTWLVIFTITYVGLFSLIIYGLYSSKEWVIDKENFKLKLEWAKWLDNTFGNTILLCILCGISLATLVATYISILLFDKKRLSDIDDFLGEKSIEILKNINDDKKARNKAWLKSYLIIVTLTILVPIAIILFILWRVIGKKIVKKST
ncbi:hypothetical protein MCSF7_01436 [Mycoplasmopsis columbina SF7]|uniref:Uncharacterized protein n=1 Tax=Mycoplasmopsis columbina SF7 TaxID=1037410 RepID=F9UK76_9BACT|nr:hypothetical protein [Mycoplasmopsis columbina]EGV00081.1 hypothetical protein MCSF7_01436 [Mycoplasmopsis columbina SF7]